MPTKSGTVRRPMCASVQTLRSPAAFPISPWTPYQPLLLPLVRHFLLPPQGLCTCCSLYLESSFPLSRKTNTSATQVWLTGRLLFLPLHLRVHPITFCPVFVACFSTAHIPSQNCDANLLYYVVGVSSPRREASNNEFPCFILLCCSWDLG